MIGPPVISFLLPHWQAQERKEKWPVAPSAAESGLGESSTSRKAAGRPGEVGRGSYRGGTSEIAKSRRSKDGE